MKKDRIELQLINMHYHRHSETLMYEEDSWIVRLDIILPLSNQIKIYLFRYAFTRTFESSFK